VPDNSIVPKNITVRFETTLCDYGPGQFRTYPEERGQNFPKYYWSQQESDASGFDFPYPPFGGLPTGTATSKLFNDTAIAGYNLDPGTQPNPNNPVFVPPGNFFKPLTGTPLNQINLDNLAAQIASDYAFWEYIDSYRVYNGILNLQPNGFYDYIMYKYLVVDKEDSEGDVTTTLITPPPNVYPDEMNHYDPQINPQNCTYVDDCFYFYSYPWICGDSCVQLPRYKICLEDGRLISYFVQWDLVTQNAPIVGPGKDGCGSLGGGVPGGGGSPPGGGGGSGPTGPAPSPSPNPIGPIPPVTIPNPNEPAPNEPGEPTDPLLPVAPGNPTEPPGPTTPSNPFDPTKPIVEQAQ
jgi:hypothetical protein